MKREMINTLPRVCSDVCPDCVTELKKEIEEHSPFRDFVVYYCPVCHERYTYLAEEE